MNNFIQLMFVANMKIDSDTLHSLYTSIRFKDKKVNNLKEKFKIWNEGRNIYIIIEKDKIENNDSCFEFTSKNGEKIKIKKFNESNIKTDILNVGDFVKISGIISYSKKIQNQENKIIEYCPVDFKGNIKEKDKFAYYLTKNTGLNFQENIDSKDRVLIERLFLEDLGSYNDEKKSKVFIKNIIMINAILEIKDKELVESLYFSSIGKRRSYGLGNLFIEKV